MEGETMGGAEEGGGGEKWKCGKGEDVGKGGKEGE